MGSEEIEKQAEELGMKVSKLWGGVSWDPRSLHFARLSETGTEANEIEGVVKDRYHLKAENYQDKRALGEVLYSCQ